jgi:hypothetical protein
MRNIHYKGIHEDKWVFGDLIHKDGLIFIGLIGNEIFQVADETVSEFTGVLDFTQWSDVPANEQNDLVTNYNITSPVQETVESFEKVWHGVPIYENDIIECHHLFDEKIVFRGAVKQYKGCFGIELINKSGATFVSFNELIEYSYRVVGNVFKIIPKENTSNNL